MGTFVLTNTKEILNHYIQVIDNAKRCCVIATPYYQPIPELEDAIERAAKRGVVIKIYGRKGEEEQFDELRDFENTELHFIDRLHAKIVKNETEITYSSMNITESSVERNVETGTYSNDPSFIKKFESEYDWLKTVPYEKSKNKNYHKRFLRQYCKICGRPKRYKPDEPLCLNCYNETIIDDIEMGYRASKYDSEYRQGFERGYNSYNKYKYRNYDYGWRGRGGYGGGHHGYW